MRCTTLYFLFLKMNNTIVSNFLQRTFPLPLDYFLKLNFQEEYCWIRGSLVFKKLGLTLKITKNKKQPPNKNKINLLDDLCFRVSSSYPFWIRKDLLQTSGLWLIMTWTGGEWFIKWLVTISRQGCVVFQTCGEEFPKWLLGTVVGKNKLYFSFCSGHLKVSLNHRFYSPIDSRTSNSLCVFKRKFFAHISFTPASIFKSQVVVIACPHCTCATRSWAKGSLKAGDLSFR